MPTLNQFVDSISQNIGLPFDNMMKEKLKVDAISARAMLIRREFDKTRRFPEYAFFTIPCFTFSGVSELDCCETVSLKCKVWRSKTKLPGLIFVKEKISASINVYSLTNQTIISYIDPSEIPFFTFRKFGAGEPRFTYSNGYLYTINIKPSALKVRAAIADLTALAEYDCESEEVCFDPSSSVFIEDHLAPTIKQIMYEEFRYPKGLDSNEVKVANEQ